MTPLNFRNSWKNWLWSINDQDNSDESELSADEQESSDEEQSPIEI